MLKITRKTKLAFIRNFNKFFMSFLSINIYTFIELKDYNLTR